MAAHGARRLLEMTANLHAVIGIELLAAAQGVDFHDGLTSSAPLEAARKTVRASVAKLEDDRYLAPDLEAATELVRSGAVAAVAGDLPGLEAAR